MSAKQAPKTRRAAGQTTLTISLPEELKAAIEEAASEEQRSTSNYGTGADDLREIINR